MILRELKFNGSNGHSKILFLPSREEITAPLIWVGDLRIVYFPETKCVKGESQESYCRRVIEEERPAEATCFARSAEVNKHLGVQYYHLAEEGSVLGNRIPVGLPTLVDIGNNRHNDSDLQRLINLYYPKDHSKDALRYLIAFNNTGKLAVVQFYNQVVSTSL